MSDLDDMKTRRVAWISNRINSSIENAELLIATLKRAKADVEGSKGGVYGYVPIVVAVQRAILNYTTSTSLDMMMLYAGEADAFDAEKRVHEHRLHEQRLSEENVPFPRETPKAARRGEAIQQAPPSDEDHR